MTGFRSRSLNFDQVTVRWNGLAAIVVDAVPSPNPNAIKLKPIAVGLRQCRSQWLFAPRTSLLFFRLDERLNDWLKIYRMETKGYFAERKATDSIANSFNKSESLVSHPPAESGSGRS